PSPRQDLVAHPGYPGTSTPRWGESRGGSGWDSPLCRSKWPCTRRRYAPSCDLHGTPARARGSHGTREGLRTVAPFRAWRGWQIPVAWGPAVIATPRSSDQHGGTSGGNSTPLERIAGAGHRYLPV